ncbi:uncharacterized protein LOC119742772 [Patiria miniata]|uniref:Uncharacterized protein n=1 Tax=Patiria miniata TaxID=46514 RepID=A0A914BG70_PATMI|nr:uncharacterized protein LOC119742772 [Patiria miniata]
MTIKEHFFVSRLVVFNETFASVKEDGDFVILWHEAISGRLGVDVASTNIKCVNLCETDIVIFWADNCTGQNKNWALYTVLYLLGFSRLQESYKRIVDRVRDDPVLSGVDIPLPNINAKSITAFFSRQDNRSNFLATAQPKVTTHRKVLSLQPMPAASKLHQSLPSPSYTQVQYKDVPHESGKRLDAKRQLEFDAPETPDLTELPPQSSASTEPKFPRRICPKSTAFPGSSGVPILLVVPSQPMAQSVSLQPASSSVPFICQPPPPPPTKQARSLPNPSTKPCAACHAPKCGGLCKRYTPSKAKTVGSNQKIFTFCPTTNKSTTTGFEEVYDNYEHFKRVVDEELEGRKSTDTRNY